MYSPTEFNAMVNKFFIINLKNKFPFKDFNFVG